MGRIPPPPPPYSGVPVRTYLRDALGRERPRIESEVAAAAAAAATRVLEHTAEAHAWYWVRELCPVCYPPEKPIVGDLGKRTPVPTPGSGTGVSPAPRPSRVGPLSAEVDLETGGSPRPTPYARPVETGVPRYTSTSTRSYDDDVVFLRRFQENGSGLSTGRDVDIRKRGRR